MHDEGNRPQSELRQDPTTRNWVIIAPQRGLRPTDLESHSQPTLSSATTSVVCPFCRGEEEETPPEVLRLNDSEGNWRLRVVPNRFAMLSEDGPPRRQISTEGFISMPGVGHHEVVIETPDHSGDLATGGEALVRDVLDVYRARYRALRAERAALIVIFRNHGRSAGTSLSHPHSQIVATPVVPIEVRHRFEVAQQHYDDMGTCLYSDILQRELADGRGIVLETRQFVAFQPFASAFPYETWLMPRLQQASFVSITDHQLDDMAGALRRVLVALRQLLDDPDYNYVIESAPPDQEDREYFVWHLRIAPRLGTPAGFELGSGMRVNPFPPEEAAAALREAVDG
jgi:UDPglucose--hexose-1-phosphate uridylyltransferase